MDESIPPMGVPTYPPTGNSLVGASGTCASGMAEELAVGAGVGAEKMR